MKEVTTDELLRMSLEEALSFSPSEVVEIIERTSRHARSHCDPGELCRGLAGQQELDQFLKIRRAAKILDISASWIYERRDKLPFIIQLPDGPLRVSVRKLREWMDRST